jgi:D-amino peptidase
MKQEQPIAALGEGAARALQAFLAATTSGSEQDRALRARTLHMLEGHTPRAFEQWKLGPVLEEAVRGLEDFSTEFPLGLIPDHGLARLDAAYIRRERNLPYALPAHGAFTRYVEHLDLTGDGLYAWLMSELMKACGLSVPIVFPERPFKPLSRLLDLYWVTHLYLLDTRYLRSPLRSPEAPQWTEDLLAEASWLLEEGPLALAAEVAICLQLAGQAGSDAHRLILDALAREQQPDGRVQDPTLDQTSGDVDAHTTAAALLAFAGAEERPPGGTR